VMIKVHVRFSSEEFWVNFHCRFHDWRLGEHKNQVLSADEGALACSAPVRGGTLSCFSLAWKKALLLFHG
jgi:hypothetical protein